MAFNLTNAIGTGTDSELLEFARAAIAAITLNGQAYTVRGKMLTRADLPELTALVTWLEKRIDADVGSSKVNYVQRQRAL
jgi:hypothetical protein